MNNRSLNLILETAQVINRTTIVDEIVDEARATISRAEAVCTARGPYVRAFNTTGVTTESLALFRARMYAYKLCLN